MTVRPTASQEANRCPKTSGCLKTSDCFLRRGVSQDSGCSQYFSVHPTPRSLDSCPKTPNGQKALNCPSFRYSKLKPKSRVAVMRRTLPQPAACALQLPVSLTTCSPDCPARIVSIPPLTARVFDRSHHRALSVAHQCCTVACWQTRKTTSWSNM